MSNPSLSDLEKFFVLAEASDPKAWARSEFEEGIPQRERYLF
ncbi:hypothetical protein [Paenarthrobacter aurescens]|nr:hypothetical protein [Paenarthrobacter aurescens]MCT9870838.1 hypothetical protein [Paenarthrobacter aurescens]